MTYARAVEIAEALSAAGVRATVDPRSVNPPCVLVTRPDYRNDLGCGVTATWRLIAMVPGADNADAWKALDALVGAVDEALGVWSDVRPTGYQVDPNATPNPAYEMTYEEATHGWNNH
jgi:hypothetical protein